VKEDTLNARQQKILHLLGEAGEVHVQELSDRFGVTPMTIRRDLETLEAQNRLTRTHGGAVFSGTSVVEFAFLERSREQTESKQAVAREAAALVEPDMTVVIDTGTTTLEVARAIAGIPGLRVLTSSLAIASELHARDNMDLVLLGGNVHRNSPDLSGSLTEDNLLQFRTQLAILGADALDAQGLYTTDMGIARVSKAMVGRADRAIVVADSSKFTRSSFVKFAEWEQIDCLVTDDGVSTEDQKWLSETVGNVRYAAT